MILKKAAIHFTFLCFCLLSVHKAHSQEPQNNDSPISLFICIDHSGSMFQGFDPQDRWGVRFNLTKTIVDIVNSKYPKSQIGIAVFRTLLYFDPQDDSRFVKCPKQENAYLPLLTLDSSHTPEGKMGHEILKEYLKTDTVGSGSFTFVDLTYQPTNVGENDVGTNINAGFDAAKHSMEFSNYEKKRQFVIFFSDGKATVGPDQNKYVEGIDMPTTFTLYFSNDGTVPADIEAMTSNVQSNGYSTSNILSDLWAAKSDFDTFLKIFKDSILPRMTIPVEIETPKKAITINNMNLKVSSYLNNLQISYTLLKDNPVTLNIFNLKGKRLFSLVDKYQNSGNHSIELNNKIKNTSGCYIAQIITKNKNISKKFILK